MEALKNKNRTVRILVIEDDERMRSLLKDFLDEEGFETDSVSNCSHAFRKPVKKPFDKGPQ
jgi:DNA-binding response OmpR family regulator